MKAERTIAIVPHYVRNKRKITDHVIRVTNTGVLP
jgi:hypothetical protein